MEDKQKNELQQLQYNIFNRMQQRYMQTKVYRGEQKTP